MGIHGFSDLDILQYEISTINAVGAREIGDFPDAESELVQKSCYQLLTYLMGFLNAFSNIYQGRTYVTRTPDDLDFSWKAHKMSERVAWVEKKLSTWSIIAKAIFSCREYNRMHPNLRTYALSALRDWDTSVEILAGSRESDQIELRVISATALPKTNFRVPSAWVKVNIWGVM